MNFLVVGGAGSLLLPGGGRVIDSVGLGGLGFAAAAFILASILLAMALMTFKPRAACAEC